MDVRLVELVRRDGLELAARVALARPARSVDGVEKLLTGALAQLESGHTLTAPQRAELVEVLRAALEAFADVGRAPADPIDEAIRGLRQMRADVAIDLASHTRTMRPLAATLETLGADVERVATSDGDPNPMLARSARVMQHVVRAMPARMSAWLAAGHETGPAGGMAAPVAAAPIPERDLVHQAGHQDGWAALADALAQSVGRLAPLLVTTSGASSLERRAPINGEDKLTPADADALGEDDARTQEDTQPITGCTSRTREAWGGPDTRAPRADTLRWLMAGARANRVAQAAPGEPDAAAPASGAAASPLTAAEPSRGTQTPAVAPGSAVAYALPTRSELAAAGLITAVLDELLEDEPASACEAESEEDDRIPAVARANVAPRSPHFVALQATEPAAVAEAMAILLARVRRGTPGDAGPAGVQRAPAGDLHADVQALLGQLVAGQVDGVQTTREVEPSDTIRWLLAAAQLEPKRRRRTERIGAEPMPRCARCGGALRLRAAGILICPRCN